MTGKELIIYILENDLLDKQIVDDNGDPIFLLTPTEAAIKYGVGVSTVRAWMVENLIEWIAIGDKLYIYENAKDPRI